MIWGFEEKIKSTKWIFLFRQIPTGVIPPTFYNIGKSAPRPGQTPSCERQIIMKWLTKLAKVRINFWLQAIFVHSNLFFGYLGRMKIWTFISLFFGNTIARSYFVQFYRNDSTWNVINIQYGMYDVFQKYCTSLLCKFEHKVHFEE